MSKFIVETTQEEQDAVLEAIKKTEGITVPVRELAELSGLSQSRVRYAILDLLEANKIERVVAKAFNKHYVRYSYKILQPTASNNKN